MRLNPVLVILLVSAIISLSFGKVIYVDDNATGSNNGTSWQNAYKYLQTALSDAATSAKPVEIRVAKGIYKPNQIEYYPWFSRDKTFQLIKDVNIFGGYAGKDSNNPDARDVHLYETILSGDLNSNDVNLDGSRNILNEPSRSENSYHVITAGTSCQNSVLDGFTITAGNANTGSMSNSTAKGGGLYNAGGAPTIINCTFKDNSAAGNGGGIYNSGKPVMTGCTFSSNTAVFYGGGLYNDANSAITLTNCTFSGNTAEYFGGGLFNYDNSNITLIGCILNENTAVYYGGSIFNNNSDTTINNCIIRDSFAGWGGGLYCSSSSSTILTNSLVIANMAGLGAGIYISNSNITITGCIFNANTAEDYGGAICCFNRSSCLVNNCTFEGNLAQYGNTVSGVSYLNKYPSNIAVNSSIIRDDNKTLWNDDKSVFTVAYCNVKESQAGLYDPNGKISWGAGNFDSDPLFAMPGYWIDVNDSNAVWIFGDYHLKSHAGRFDPNSQTWIMDDVTSPCVDTGDPDRAIGYEPAPNGRRINVGAYGGTEEASKSESNMVDSFSHASNPGPADNETAVFLDTTLSWISDPNAVAHEVYFGTDRQPPFVEKVYGSTFTPGLLKPNTKYYWRVDELDDPLSRVRGDIWTFTTGALYAHALNPYPADEALSVSSTVVLSWSSQVNVIGYDVYLGTNEDDVLRATITNQRGVLVSAQHSTNFDPPGVLALKQTYYWRVDTILNNGTIITGYIWTFTTRDSDTKPIVCFIGQTPVWIDGKAIPISAARVDQNIGGIGKIEQVQEHVGVFVVYDVLFESGNSITVADDHYFLTESGKFHSLHELKAGDKLKTSGGLVAIKSITKLSKPYSGTVYNLKIAGSDQYMVGKDAVIVRDY
jgi:hypothetical protein